MSKSFDAFWAAYPRRKGANPKAPARTAYDRVIKKGVQPEVLLKAAQAYAADPDTAVGTPYVPMTVTWLNQKRWEAHARERAPIGKRNGSAGVLVRCDTPAWDAWVLHLGKRPPVNKQFGWYFPSEWPPEDAQGIRKEPSQQEACDPDWNPEKEFIATEHVYPSEFIG